MILYHGSNVMIETPDVSKSKPFKDFGQGFYLSAVESQACDMAKNRVNITRTGTPVVNKFEFDENILKSSDFKVKIWDNYCVEWARFVDRNRDEKMPPLPVEYDIIYGPIANDGVNFQLRRYRAGYLTIEELVSELIYDKGITFQYFFATEKALKTLKRV